MAASPLWILLHSWKPPANPYGAFDVAVNLALYIPLGISGGLFFRRFQNSLLAIAGPVALGTLLSASIEMAQLFEPSRYCSALDLMTNIAGSALGVAVARGFMSERRASRRLIPLQSGWAAVLLLTWIGWYLFPLFPVPGRTALRHKAGVFTQAPRGDVVILFSAMATWFVAGKLMRAAGLRPARVWLVGSVLLIPAQFLIVTRQPSPSEFAGAVAGTLLFLAAGDTRAGWPFAGILILRGLAPFHFTTHAQTFSWMPFGGFLAMDWQSGTRLLLEKAFYYGSAIWLLKSEGQRGATPIVATILAAIEFAQIYVPGRTPEITDPLIAILLGTALSSGGTRYLSRIAGRRFPEAAKQTE